MLTKATRKRNRQNRNIVFTKYNTLACHYYEIAQNALQSNHGEEAYEYAAKVLEKEPAHFGAWLIKMKSIEYIEKLGKPRFHEVISCSRNAIRYCDDANRADVKNEIYTYLLNRAIALVSMAISYMHETENIKSLTNSERSISPVKVGNRVISSDSVLINMLDDLVLGALELKNEISKHEILTNEKYQVLVNTLVNNYLLYIQALTDRLLIYDMVLDDNGMIYYRKLLDTLKTGLPKDLAAI